MNKRNKKVKYTKEEKIKFRKSNKVLCLITNILLGMFIVCTGYLTINLLKLTGIENIIRYICIGIIIIITLVLIIKNFGLKNQPKKTKIFIFIIILLILGSLELYVGNIISRGIRAVDNMNKSNNEVTYTSALIALADNEITSEDLGDAKIGIITDSEDVEGYVLAQEIINKLDISKSNLVKFDSYIMMLTDLYDKEIDAAFVSGSYVSKYSGLEKFTNIESDVKVIEDYSKSMKKVTTSSTESNNKDITEPFTMLILGVDSPEEDINEAIALGDTIMLVTFNPKTLNATLFSIPRDTYVPITCYSNAMSKITHAASGGDSCMIETVQNFTGIQIDYYAKVNFLGLINLVDALGGIDVDVPYSFCETDENRTFYNGVMVKKGLQHLSGREALGLARNRKYYPTCGEEYNEGERNDFVRGQNQQLVLKAILNAAKQLRTVDDFYSILEAISKSLDTNLTREQILGFYNIFKKVLLSTDSLSENNDVISIQRTYLNGSDGYIMDYVAGTGLYEFVPSSQSLNAIVTAMKINLELESETYDTSFSFSVDNAYEAKIIGSDLYGGVTSYPQFVAPEETTTTEEITCKKSGSVYHKFKGDVEDTSVDYTESNCVCHKASNGTYVDGSINSYSDSKCTIIINEDEEETTNNYDSTTGDTNSSTSSSTGSSSTSADDETNSNVEETSNTESTETEENSSSE